MRPLSILKKLGLDPGDRRTKPVPGSLLVLDIEAKAWVESVPGNMTGLAKFPGASNLDLPCRKI